MGIEHVAAARDYCPRAELLACLVRRTEVIAAAAFRAAVAVEPVIPAQVRQLARAVVLEFFVFEIQLGQPAHRLEVAQIDGESRGDDVKVLAQGQQVQERQQDHEMHPPVDGVHRVQRNLV